MGDTNIFFNQDKEKCPITKTAVKRDFCLIKLIPAKKQGGRTESVAFNARFISLSRRKYRYT